MPITSFNVTPPIIQAGEKATLSWTSEGCTDLYLLPIPGHPQGFQVDPNGSYEVEPDRSSVYMVTGRCDQDPNESTVLLMVDET